MINAGKPSLTDSAAEVFIGGRLHGDNEVMWGKAYIGETGRRGEGRGEWGGGGGNGERMGRNLGGGR